MPRVVEATLHVLGGCVSFAVSAVFLAATMFLMGAVWGAGPALVALAALLFCTWSFWRDRTPRGAIVFGVPALVACGGFALSLPFTLGRLSECQWGTANTITTAEHAIDHALRVTAGRRETLVASGFGNADEFVAGLRDTCCHATLAYDAQLLRWQWTVNVTSRGWLTTQVFNRCGLKVEEFRSQP